MIEIAANSNIFGLSEQHYGKIKRVGMLNDEPILYGDPNLLKNNDLYYIIGAKQVYRYIKCEVRHTGGASSPGILNPTPSPVGGNVFNPNTTTKEYYFETFNGSDSEVLSVPEDERGKIRNAGYLFNEIIYSGDPNLVDNGQLFYHDTLPYISIISNVDGVINVSTKTIRLGSIIGTIVNEYTVYTPYDYSKDYLTFRALEKGKFTLDIPSSVNATYMESVSYSIDNGKTWVTTQINSSKQTITTPTINAGDKVLWKGVGNQTAKSYLDYSHFTSTKKFKISGNIMSIFYGDDFTSQTAFPQNSEYNLSRLFINITKLIDIENLVLPATTLTLQCYRGMFEKCTSLKTTPSNLLPATTLVEFCYGNMFQDCTSLTSTPELPATTLAYHCYSYMFSACNIKKAPELPATTLASYCYSNMFYKCTSLTTAPVLPATTLTDYCYHEMFYNCTSLTTAPELPATILAEYCYGSMFSGCTSLVNAPELSATTLAQSCYYSMFSGTSIQTAPELPAIVLLNNCYQYMFSGCTLLTTAPELPATTLAYGCYMGMFNGCTSLTTTPELSATQLADSCYYDMFRSCTSLTIAPILPATTLISNCYTNMFLDCSSLNYIKAMFTTTPSNTYTKDWVKNVATTGTFVKNTSAEWTTTGTNAVPTGWTVETEPSDEITI